MTMPIPISSLNEIMNPTISDYFPIVDVSELKTRRITIASLLALVNTSSSFVQYTGVPATDRANLQSALNLAAKGSYIQPEPGHIWELDQTITIPVGVWLGGQIGYRATSYSCKLKTASGFTGTTLIAFAPGTPCGGLANLVLDGTDGGASTNGVDNVGPCKFGTLYGLNIGNFGGHGVYIKSSGGNPDGWLYEKISAHDNGGAGIWDEYAVDQQIIECHLDKNLSGLALGTMNNVTVSHVKCQQNTEYGYTDCGSFIKSNATLAHCFAENNGYDDFHFNFASGSGGQGSLQMIGCSSRDCGQIGGVRTGPGYASFWINSKNVDISMIGCSNYITDSLVGPDYGIKLTGCLGNVAIIGGSFGGSVAWYNDGGGNTGTIKRKAVTTWTGQGGSRTFSMVDDGGSSNAAPVNFKPSNPTGIDNTGPVMMGMGSTCSFTPSGSGKVILMLTGVVDESLATTNALIGPRYGTGVAPNNGVAATGTRWGATSDVTFRVHGVGAPGVFMFTDVLTLSPGLTYWFDVNLNSSNANTVNIKSPSLSIMEH